MYTAGKEGSTWASPGGHMVLAESGGCVGGGSRRPGEVRGQTQLSLRLGAEVGLQSLLA